MKKIKYISKGWLLNFTYALNILSASTKKKKVAPFEDFIFGDFT